MRYLPLIFMILSCTSYADCYLVGGFQGMGARENDKFSFEKDGMSGQKFMVEIAGNESRVIPNDMRCIEAGYRTIVCSSEVPDRASVETWAIYPNQGVAIFTKVRNGAGVFNDGMVMLGKIMGACRE